MQAAMRGILFVIAIILLIFGAIDLAGQLKAGDDFHWGMPIVLIGFGTGIPFVLFSFPNMFSTEHGGEESDDYGSYDGGGDSGSD